MYNALGLHRWRGYEGTTTGSRGQQAQPRSHTRSCNSCLLPPFHPQSGDTAVTLVSSWQVHEAMQVKCLAHSKMAPDSKDFQSIREIDTMNTKWMIVPTRGMLGKIISVLWEFENKHVLSQIIMGPWISLPRTQLTRCLVSRTTTPGGVSEDKILHLWRDEILLVPL